MNRIHSKTVVLLALLLALAACNALPAVELARDTVAGSPAADYCVEKGGRVVTRQPYYATNSPREGWLAMGEPRQFCNFENPEVEVEDTGFRSQIEIDLDSLYSERPTLALLAYLQGPEPNLEGVTRGANPSPIHCGQLGGSARFGLEDDTAGSGWAKPAEDTSSIFDLVNFCVFPDGSAIETWGITYRSTGTTRGVALEDVVRYQPETYPFIFNRE